MSEKKQPQKSKTRAEYEAEGIEAIHSANAHLDKMLTEIKAQRVLASIQLDNGACIVVNVGDGLNSDLMVSMIANILERCVKSSETSPDAIKQGISGEQLFESMVDFAKEKMAGKGIHVDEDN